MWRLEPEGEAEKPGATAPWSGVKGVSVNPGGESCNGQAQAKMARKERKLTITEKEKEGKSKMIASRGFLEDELRQCGEEEGLTMADSVETLGVDLRTKVKRLGAKEKARRNKCWVRFSIIKKNEALSYMKVGVKKSLRAGMVPARTWGAHAVGWLQRKDSN